MACQHQLREQGHAYPRTCADCGLGPCHKLLTVKKQLLPPHQQRVVDEKVELDHKLDNLRVFFGTPIFKGLPEAEQGRMGQQAAVMNTYSEILASRIAAF